MKTYHILILLVVILNCPIHVARSATSTFDETKPIEELDFATLPPKSLNLTHLLGSGGQKKVYLTEFQGKSAAAYQIGAKDEALSYRLKLHQYLSRSESVKGIVRSLGIVRQGDTFTHFVEYFKDKDLSDYLQKKGNLPLQEWKKIGKQLCQTIVGIHERNIVHRDIKPANVFVSDYNGKLEVALGDWDLALHFGDDFIKNFGLAGTAEFCSPRYAETESDTATQGLANSDPEFLDINLRNDYWGFGMTLLTGMSGTDMPWESSFRESWDSGKHLQLSQKQVNKNIRNTLFGFKKKKMSKEDLSQLSWIRDILFCSLNVSGKSTCDFPQLCSQE